VGPEDRKTARYYGPAPADTDADLRAIYRAITARALERVVGEEAA